MIGRASRGLAGASVVIGLLLLAASRAGAAQVVLTLDAARTQVTFELKATGHVVHGTLPVTSGAVRFDATTGAASGEVLLDARSASTANDGRDRKMHEKVLETEQNPVISFRPERLEGTLAGSGSSEVKLHGVVTLVGKEHPVVLPAHVEVTGAELTGTASLVVPYVAWGLDDPSVFLLRVAKEVEVRVEVTGTLTPLSTPER